jgi:hypothetical protein
MRIVAAWIEAAIWRMPYIAHPADLSEQLSPAVELCRSPSFD